MGVYDSWHRAGPGQPCREHGLIPAAGHGRGDRWQVRWRDDAGRQRKRSFRLKSGRNPGLHADAFSAMIERDLDTGDYVDPGNGDITLMEYADDWRRSRSHDAATAAGLERRLRVHVYEDPGSPGRTVKGGLAIGQRRMAELARRPSLIQAWLRSLPLAESSAAMVAASVSAVFRAAVDDGIVTRDPVKAASVQRPRARPAKARPWTAAQAAAMAAALPGRCGIVPLLGAGTGMRQGEMFGLAVDDITFLGRDPRIAVGRQVKLIGNVPHFAPLKNRKPHTVPLAASLAPRLARHLELYPAVAVSLPWHDEADPGTHGRLVTVRLVLTDTRGRAWLRQRFNETWHAAQVKAGLPGDGCHVLRHTAASAWLRAGIDVIRVAAWLGDTPEVVLRTYAHLMPGHDDDDGRAATDAFFGGQSAADVPDAGSADA